MLLIDISLAPSIVGITCNGIQNFNTYLITTTTTTTTTTTIYHPSIVTISAVTVLNPQPCVPLLYE